MCETEEKWINKFFKNLLGVLENEKKNGYIIFLVFSSLVARMRKKNECEKKNSAETKQEEGWATAQLGHDTMGNCIVTQQVMGMQFGLEDWVTIQ